GWDDEGKDSVPSAWIKRHDQVVFLGKVEDMHELLANIHVFVLPSYREGTPRSVLEAMATGRPVITTDVPGCRETVLPGRNGWLVPPRDVPGLVRAMEEALALSLEDLKRMGDASRKLAEERFDAAFVSRKILDGMGLC
ncbi:glycosyltransferase, partial [Candidatus Parcubacteria bacterium]